MNMPVKVSNNNYRAEMKNTLSEKCELEFQINSTTTELLKTSITKAQCNEALLEPADGKASSPMELMLSKKTKTSANTKTTANVSTINGINCSTMASSQVDSEHATTIDSTTPILTLFPRSIASATKASDDENNVKTPLTSLKSSPTSAIIVATITNNNNNNTQQVQQPAGYNKKNQLEAIYDDENELNFDRGKESSDEILVEEFAMEAYDDNDKEEKLSCKDTCSTSDDEISGVSDDHSGIEGEERQVPGCVHYKRRAMFVTPCCNKFYKCRYCHDENEDHHFDRKTLTELICSECDTRQRVQETCENCGVRFGKYICLICNLFDDEDKAQYHCYGCGICRIGGRKNFFHCEVCNMCLPIQLKIEGHRCVENISRSNCPVCLGDIHTSRIPCHIPDCGHLLHKMCFDQLLASGHYVCPTCQTSIIDMTKMWEYLDAQALIMPVPKSYENRYVNIFCNDCHKSSTVKFHFVGLKCFYCGGYNTTQDMKRRRSWVTVNDNASSA